MDGRHTGKVKSYRKANVTSGWANTRLSTCWGCCTGRSSEAVNNSCWHQHGDQSFIEPTIFWCNNIVIAHCLFSHSSSVSQPLLSIRLARASEFLFIIHTHWRHWFWADEWRLQCNNYFDVIAHRCCSSSCCCWLTDATEWHKPNRLSAPNSTLWWKYRHIAFLLSWDSKLV